MDDTYSDEKPTVVGRVKHSLWISWMFLAYLFDRTIAFLSAHVALIGKELDLFLGVALFIIGILGFESGRYCDGNTAEYLSCTRPATFYFYDAVHIALIILGVFLVLAWLLKRSRAAR